MLTLRRHQSAKPLGRRLVAERTQGVTRNSEIAQVLGRMLTLPIAVLREILQHLDTKVLRWTYRSMYHNSQIGTWTGTQRMQNKARLRRRVGQTGWTSYPSTFENLEVPTVASGLIICTLWENLWMVSNSNRPIGRWD